MNDSFLEGFYKIAGVPGMIGKLVGKGKNLPAAVGGAIHAAPAAAKKGVKAVGEQVARNQREFAVSKARELGRTGRIGAGIKTSPDFSKQVQQGKIMTGKTSPAAIAKARGSFGSRVKNVAAATAVGGAAGLHYGMKENDDERVR